MYYSLFGQFEQHGGTDVSGLKNGAVVAIKGILYLVGIAALIRSVQSAVNTKANSQN